MNAVDPVDIDVNQHSKNYSEQELDHEEGISMICSIFQAFPGLFYTDSETGYGKYQSIFIIKSEFSGTIPIAVIFSVKRS